MWMCTLFLLSSYIPEMYVNQEGELTDKAKIDINNLNAELVHKLKAQDTAFSTGESSFSSAVSYCMHYICNKNLQNCCFLTSNACM